MKEEKRDFNGRLIKILDSSFKLTILIVTVCFLLGPIDFVLKITDVLFLWAIILSGPLLQEKIGDFFVKLKISLGGLIMFLASAGIFKAVLIFFAVSTKLQDPATQGLVLLNMLLTSAFMLVWSLDKVMYE